MWRKPQEQEPRGDPVNEKKRQPRKYEDTTSSFAEAEHLEWKSWIDNEVFDLVDMRKFKPKYYVTGTMGTHHQDRQTMQLPQGEGQELRGFQDKQKLPTDRFSCVHEARIFG